MTMDYSKKFASLWRGTGKKSGKLYWSGPLADDSGRRLLLFPNDKADNPKRPDLVAFIVDQDDDGEQQQQDKPDQGYTDIPF